MIRWQSQHLTGVFVTYLREVSCVVLCTLCDITKQQKWNKKVSCAAISVFGELTDK